MYIESSTEEGGRCTDWVSSRPKSNEMHFAVEFSKAEVQPLDQNKRYYVRLLNRHSLLFVKNLWNA